MYLHYLFTIVYGPHTGPIPIDKLPIIVLINQVISLGIDAPEPCDWGSRAFSCQS